jgi:hypothetical protein
MPGFRIRDVGSTEDDAVNHRTEVYYKYTFKVDFNRILKGRTGAVGFPARVANFNDPNAGVMVKDVVLPNFTVNKGTVKGAALEYKHAKSVTYDDVKVSWYDTEELLSTILLWRSTVWSPQLGLSATNEYKAISVIEQYLPSDGLTAPTREYKLINSWPSVIKHGELTYTDSEVNLVEVTLTYDWAEITPPDSIVRR